MFPFYRVIAMSQQTLRHNRFSWRRLFLAVSSGSWEIKARILLSKEHSILCVSLLARLPPSQTRALRNLSAVHLCSHCCKLHLATQKLSLGTIFNF